MRAFHSIQVAGAVLAAGVFTTGCSMETVSSKQVTPDAIHQDYSVNYREASNTTEMTAQFRVGGWSGTTVELESPANLTINGIQPGHDSVLGTMYQANSSGFTRNVDFQYTSANGQVTHNSISMDPVYVTAANPTLVLNQSYQVTVQVPNFSPGESLTADIQQNGANGQMTLISGSFDPQRGIITFSLSDLSRLYNGSATLEIHRTRMGSLSQPTPAGGGISASYYAKPVSLTVTGGPSSANLLRP